MIHNRLAHLIKLAAELREKSYDQKASDAAVANKTSTDFTEFYRLTVDQAAERACRQRGEDQHLALPIATLLRTHWNSSLEWANEMLNLDTGA